MAIALPALFFSFLLPNFDHYYKDDPSQCASCHVVAASVESWRMDRHSPQVRCSDCHFQENSVSGAIQKFQTALSHSYLFTMSDSEFNLRLNKEQISTMNARCISCHKDQFTAGSKVHNTGLKCLHCHAGAGHK